MKCFNCNNEIPETSVVCPYCNANITPAPGVGATPAPSVLPVTPTEPMLPTDQNLVVNPSEVTPSQEVASPVTQAVNPAAVANADNSVSVAPSSNQIPTSVTNGIPGSPVNPAPSSPVNSTPVVPSVTPTPASPLTSGITPAPATPVNSASVAPTAPVMQVPAGTSSPQVQGGEGLTTVPETPQTTVNQPLQNDINPEFIAPSGEVIDGGKIGNTVPVQKKKSKTKKIIIIFILIVILIAGGIGVYYYYSQYQTSSKRVSAVFNGMTSLTAGLRNETIDKSSGTYKLDLNLNYNDNSFSTKINGKYANHISGKAFDLTANIEELKTKENLINAPVNLEVYYNESKIYLLFENLYDQYIYEEWGDIEPYLDNLSKNEIKYVTLINSLKRATSESLSKLASTQSVKTVNIHGESKKVNAVNIRLNARNQMIFFNNFYRILANDKLFLTELSKLLGNSEEELKESLLENTKETEYKDSGLMIEIYTAMFKSEFAGMKLLLKDEKINNVIEIYPSGNGYGISYSQNSQNIFEGSFEVTKKNTSTTREKLYKIDFSIYVGEVAYKLNTSLNIIGDVNPKDAKVNVKNSVNKMYLTDEVKNTILTKYNELGNIALEFPDLMKDYLGVTDPIVTSPIDNCSPGMNCQTPVIEGN